MGDELVFDSLGWGLVGSVVLSMTAGLVGGRRSRSPWWAGFLIAVACLLAWASLFIAPWRVF